MTANQQDFGPTVEGARTALRDLLVVSVRDLSIQSHGRPCHYGFTPPLAPGPSRC